MKCFQIAHGSLMKADIQWKLRGNHILKFHKNLEKCGMLRRWCFIATQNFKLKNITRCELWKRQIQPWIVTLLFGTIQRWFCLFHSSHLVMCFNLKFCVAIKHHPLNIPRIIRLHRWILLDRTMILIPYDSTCKCFQIAPPKKCFQIAHGSHTKAVCLPNRGRCPCCARDLSHAFWLARTQTPRNVCLHPWMLPDWTATLSPFDSTCSTRFSIHAPVSCHSSHQFPTSSPIVFPLPVSVLIKG